jgi:hypothetical protein
VIYIILLERPTSVRGKLPISAFSANMASRTVAFSTMKTVEFCNQLALDPYRKVYPTSKNRSHAACITVPATGSVAHMQQPTLDDSQWSDDMAIDHGSWCIPVGLKETPKEFCKFPSNITNDDDADVWIWSRAQEISVTDRDTIAAAYALRDMYLRVSSSGAAVTVQDQIARMIHKCLSVALPTSSEREAARRLVQRLLQLLQVELDVCAKGIHLGDAFNLYAIE